MNTKTSFCLPVVSNVALCGGVSNDVTVIQEVTEDSIVSEILMERARGPVSGVAEDEEDDDCVTPRLSDAAIVMHSLHCFLMSRKDIPDVLWESCDIVTELWKNPY
jgi:hypothetical protein